MRRTMLLIAMTVAALLSASGVAFAVTKVCPTGVVCNGTRAADVLKGTAGINKINGLPGNDRISGLGGNDTLSGDAGNDSVNGAGGDDTYVLKDGWGLDSLVDASGTDTLNTAAVTWHLTVDLTPSTQEPEVSAGFNFANWSGDSIEHVIGGRGNDVISDNSAANRLNGGPGHDEVLAGAGNDTLQGGLGGADLLTDTGESNDAYSGFTGAFGPDAISDRSGGADSLDLRTFDIGAATVTAEDVAESFAGGTPNGNYDSLRIRMGGTDAFPDEVVVLDYYNNLTANPCALAPGSSLVEAINFRDSTVTWFSASNCAPQAARSAASAGTNEAQAAPGGELISGFPAAAHAVQESVR